MILFTVTSTVIPPFLVLKHLQISRCIWWGRKICSFFYYLITPNLSGSLQSSLRTSDGVWSEVGMSLMKRASLLIINNSSLFKGESLQQNRTVGVTLSCLYNSQSANGNPSLQRNVKFTLSLKRFRFPGGEKLLSAEKLLKNSIKTAWQHHRIKIQMIFDFTAHFLSFKGPGWCFY